MTQENTEPIFIHSLFRSGSTFVYNAIKRTGKFHVYHEPFHEIIANLPTEWEGFAERTRQLKDLLRHDFLDGGYFDEYAHLLEEIKLHFTPDISYKLYFLDEQDESPALKSYVDTLINGSLRRPVIQCTRSMGRLPWLRKNYPSRNVFLLRNPWDQWYSYKVDPYISTTPQLIYSQPRLPQVLQEVMTACGFSPLQGGDLLEMRTYSAQHPITPLVDYSLFFGLWLFSLLTAQKECELILNMDTINRGAAEKVQAQGQLAAIGLEDIDLHDYNLRRTYFKNREAAFYQQVESRVLELFQQDSLHSASLAPVEEYLAEERSYSFIDSEKSGEHIRSIFEDAARLRSNLASTGNDQARVFEGLNQTIQSLSEQLSREQQESQSLALQLNREQLENQLLVVRLSETEKKARSLVDQLSEITSSGIWRLGSAIAPVGSRRDQAIDRILSSISTSGLRFGKKRRLEREMELVRSSGLFDEAWYLKNNPDVAQAQVNPLLHYLEKGAAEGRDPGPGFSTRWYLESYPDVSRLKVNPLVHYLAHGISEGRKPMPSFSGSPGQQVETRSALDESTKDQLTVFTICSRNFTAYAKTLFESLEQHHPGADMHLVLCDDVDPEYLREQFPFNIVPLTELDIPGVQEMAQRYNITEFNTAIKPYAFSYLFKRLGREKIVYLDPDILILSPLQEVLDAFSRGAECVLTPHILEPAEKAEMSDIKFLQFGAYNLGFLALRNTPDVLEVVDWWGRQLVDKCVIDLAQGLFVDQKWADLFPAFIRQVHVIHHPGYNIAYWNLSQRKVELINDRWYSNQMPVRFVHFSGNNLNDPYFLSRHSGVHTRDTMGDFNYLLKSYRQRIFENGHAEYSKIPYSFSWGGASGINLHTPKPYVPAESIQLVSPVVESANPVARLTGKTKAYWKLLRGASQMSGGWLPLTKKVLRALREGGISTLRYRAHFANSYVEMASAPARSSSVQVQDFSQDGRWTSSILVVDSTIPRPDRDAGSLSTFNIIKIYLDLGYDVTFIPSDLAYLSGYAEALQELGVRCLYRPEIDSIQQHLQKEGGQYDFVILCRAPIAAPYLADVRRFAPRAKILFDTIDLHYLRDAREAELDGSPEKIKAAEAARKWEQGIMRQCDVTIVLSSVEAEILKKELPDVDIRLIPLIFVDNVYEVPPFEERRDFLFIGGFPHLPNVDAVLYFCDEVLPLIRKELPDIKFHIVGNAPPPEVLELGKREGVIVHGFVKDVTPLFRSCRLSVAPLRFGAGIKGKIATSLAYGVPAIATSLAAEGMDIEPGRHVLVADDPQEFADAFIRAYQSEELWTALSNHGRHQALRAYSATAGYQRISRLMQDINPRHHQIDLYTLRSFQEYDLLRQTLSEEISERRATELKLIEHDQPSFYVDGFCAVCGCESRFITSFMYSVETMDDGRPIPNWREHLACEQCGYVNRLRAAMHFFYQRLNPAGESSIYITEQATPLFAWLKKRHIRLVGSEYLGDAVPYGRDKDGLRNEDLTALTFPDSSFDYVISFDVMEHVSDDMAALKEVYRCLKPGGTFMFTAPFRKDRAEKLVRARMLADGSIEHILPPEYHGNPVDQENGSLCFRYFAWDLVEDMKKAGFEDPRILNYWSRDFAYLGLEQFIFIANKAAG